MTQEEIKELTKRAQSEFIEERSSSIHQQGVFAAKDIPKETRIVEYVGEKITKTESNRRGWALIEETAETGDGSVYLFTLNKRYDIDGNFPFNTPRLINHSCSPNCETQIIRGKIWFIALKNISKGEELTFDYNFDLENYADHPCRCGSANCVGYIVGQGYWSKLKKILRKKEKK